jgi:aliphatic sulfonates family ABC transporter substrate-binding protein
MIRARLLVVIAVLVCAAGLGLALARSGNAETDGALRLAYQNRIGSGLCIVAVENNLFQQEGLSVRAFRFNSGPACAEALYSGSADIATMGDTTAVIAVSRDDRFRIIASHGAGEHRHRIVVRGDGTIRRPADLIGKRLAVKKGTSTYGGLLAFCAERNIALASISVVDMRPHEMTDALLSGSVDAFVASEPTPSIAEAKGARELATLGGLGNNYPILVVARADYLREHPAQVEAFLQAMRRAEHFITDQPEAAVATLAHVTGLAGEATRRAMGRHRYRLVLDKEIRRSLNATARFLLEQGTIEALPNWDRVLAP